RRAQHQEDLAHHRGDPHPPRAAEDARKPDPRCGPARDQPSRAPLQDQGLPDRSMTVEIRRARDDDAQGLIELIGGVFAEYPGCVLDVDGELPELRAIATSFEGLGGRFWTAEVRSAVVGCIGVVPSAHGRGAELRKLYVAKTARRAGLGSRLCSLAEEEA